MESERNVKRTSVRLAKGLRVVLRGRIWYAETCIDSHQRRISLETGDFDEAKRLAFELKDRPTGRPKPAAPVSKSLTMGQAAEQYEKWYRGRYKATGAYKVMETVDPFVEFVGAETQTRRITRDQHVKTFIDKLKVGRKPITVNGKFACLRAFLRWISRQDENEFFMSSNICRGVDNLPKDEGIPKASPDRDTVAAAIRAMRGHPWLADFSTLLVETGMRPSEALAVRGVDVKKRQGKILLTIQPYGDWSPKSKASHRTIELNPVAAAVVERRLKVIFEPTMPLFGKSNGKRRGWSHAYHLFKTHLPERLEHLTLYDLKHHFCSEHAAPGPGYMAPEILGSYIGHSSKSTRTLLGFYVDHAALRRGAPTPLLAKVSGKRSSHGSGS